MFLSPTVMTLTYRTLPTPTVFLVLIVMPSGRRRAEFEVIAVSDWAGENVVASHQEFGPGSHRQTQEMFLAACVRLHVVARAFRRMTMLMLVHSGAGVTLVTGSFANGAMDGIVTRPQIGRASCRERVGQYV